MSPFSPKQGEADRIGPSLLHDGVLALGCLALGIGLLRMEDATVEGATIVAVFALLSAVAIMAAHLPGCTGVWLDDEGFLVRDMYKSARYRWSDVGPFTLRRRLFGWAIDFSFKAGNAAVPETRSLPRGLGGSGWKIAQRMNERRERAVGAGR